MGRGNLSFLVAVGTRFLEYGQIRESMTAARERSRGVIENVNRMDLDTVLSSQQFM